MTHKTIKFILLLLLGTTANLYAQIKPTQTELINTIQKVNDYWQSTHPNPGNPFWDNAAYHTGN